jgi:L-fuconolactonase
MIIDAHTHFYDPTRPEGVPWPSPTDEFLYRPFLSGHHKAVALPEGVTGTIIVEASSWVEDNRWILDLAADDPFVVGFVGHMEPGSEDFGKHLDRFAANPLFRGIRIGGTIMQGVEQKPFLADIEKLVEKDLELDLLISPEGLAGTAALAKRFPDLRIVVNHVACVRIDGKAPDAVWVEGMQMAARHNNVYCKVSSLVSLVQDRPTPTDVGYYTPTLDAVWEAFGEDRVIYGSDWPYSGLRADYATGKRIVTEYFKEKGREATEKYFWKNSRAAYRWIDRG